VWGEEMRKWAQKNHARGRAMMVEGLKVNEKCSA